MVGSGYSHCSLHIITMVMPYVGTSTDVPPLTEYVGGQSVHTKPIQVISCVMSCADWFRKLLSAPNDCQYDMTKHADRAMTWVHGAM